MRARPRRRDPRWCTPGDQGWRRLHPIAGTEAAAAWSSHSAGLWLASHETQGDCAEKTRMAGYSSGDLFWDTAEPRAPRWVLLLDGPPGVARRRLDPQERSMS